MLNIVIFGAPGSGKGTNSAILVDTFKLDHISTGDVLRGEIKNGTELGKIAQSYIDHGNLIPDELMIDILASKYDSFKDSKGVIFDGFPRTIAQANALKKMLEERGEKISTMINLEVDESLLMDRLLIFLLGFALAITTFIFHCNSQCYANIPARFIKLCPLISFAIFFLVSIITTLCLSHDIHTPCTYKHFISAVIIAKFFHN